MTAADVSALAAWLEASASVEDITWPERAAKSRAAAAALRGLVAERDSLEQEVMGVGVERDLAEHNYYESRLERDYLRRKVARYVKAAREWRQAAVWNDDEIDRLERERDEARALGRELAQGVDEYWAENDGKAAVAKARAAGWLEG